MMRMSASRHAFHNRKEARQGKKAPSVMGEGVCVGGGGVWVQRKEVAKVKERARQRRKWQDVMRQEWEAVNR